MPAPSRSGASPRGWTISGNPQTATVEFRNPHGQRYDPNPATLGDTERVIEANRQAGVTPGPDTITPIELGARYDHELTIWIMANLPKPDPASAEPPTG